MKNNEIRFKYQGNAYLVDIELCFQNVPLVFVYELDDITLKYAGDTGKNLYLVFDKMLITKDELIEHCNKYLMEIWEK